MTARFLLHSNDFTERGDSVTLLSIAKCLRTELGLSSIIVLPENAETHVARLEEAYSNQIGIFQYSCKEELDAIAQRFDISHSYVFSSGRRQDLPYFDPANESSFRIGNTKHITHVVFRNFEPHGDYYFYVSDWLLQWSKKSPRVLRKRFKIDRSSYRDCLITSWPHFVDFSGQPRSGSIRQQFNIPNSAFTIGRIGGFDQFDDPAAHAFVRNILEDDANVYVLVVNTKEFYEHPRLIYLPYLSRDDVPSFYRDIDLFLNARLMGESFGYSIVEPLYFDKPVLAPHPIRNLSMDKNHYYLLRDFGFLYFSDRHLQHLVEKYRSRPIVAGLLSKSVSDFSGHQAMHALKALLKL